MIRLPHALLALVLTAALGCAAAAGTAASSSASCRLTNFSAHAPCLGNAVLLRILP